MFAAMRHRARRIDVAYLLRVLLDHGLVAQVPRKAMHPRARRESHCRRGPVEWQPAIRGRGILLAHAVVARRVERRIGIEDGIVARVGADEATRVVQDLERQPACRIRRQEIVDECARRRILSGR